MRHIDFLLDAWNTDAESAAVQASVTRLQEAIDRYQIYLEAVGEPESEIPIDRVWASLFVRGWLGRRWVLRRELKALIWAGLADDRVRSLLMFLASRARTFERVLRRLEHARRGGDQATASALRDELAEMDKDLTKHVRLQGLQLFGSPSPWRCPGCGQRYVVREEFFGDTVMFGCELCTLAETGRGDELARLEHRWTPATGGRTPA